MTAVATTGVPPMPDKYLVGNGVFCEGCGLRQRQCEELDLAAWAKPRPRLQCNCCDGTGRIGFTCEAIIANTVAQKREGRA